MKNKKNMKPTCTGVRSFASLATVALLLAGAAACTEDLISQPVGELPDEAAIGRIGSTMRSGLSFTGRGEVVLAEPVEGEEPETVVADELYYELSQPAAADTKVTLSIGTGLTPEFLEEYDRVCALWKERTRPFLYSATSPGAALFPKQNVQWDAGGLTVPAGKRISETFKISISNVGLSMDTLYLLPVVIEQTGSDGHRNTQILQYRISVNPELLFWSNINTPGQEITLDQDFFTVFYVNTETYQPLIADIFAYGRYRRADNVCEKTCTIGNLVNLRPASLGYDVETDRALFNLGPDLRYVLEHRLKYIVPLQNHGRKVCICIQGGGKGLGFCNLSDAQIADFTAQVKKVLEDYGLDGVNLWDEGAKYGKEGMPAVNTTSYPKLIKSLREALPNKLLTLVDKDEPTEYFHDVSACGGIEVGKYLDYAWSGYCTDRTNVQIVEPWETDHPFGDIVRKPIAGLAPEQYGSFSVPRLIRGGSTLQDVDFPKRLIDWRVSGRKKNNMVVFLFDLTANEQTKWEGEPLASLGAISYISEADDITMYLRKGKWRFRYGSHSRVFFATHPEYQMHYIVLPKDW